MRKGDCQHDVPLRAALYLRVSTARQAKHDVSIPDQKRQGEAYCQSRGYLLRTLAAGSGVKSGKPGVRSSVPTWRATPDSDDHCVYAVAL